MPDKRLLGPFLIGIAAILWATDALFRFPTSGRLDPALIVFGEHLIALAVLSPWALIRYRGELFRMSSAEWFFSFVIGAGASALATLFFTASFRYVNPSVAILLQKLQPVLVVALAALFLGERPRGTFLGWALLALGSGVVLSFPDLSFSFVQNGLDLHSQGVLYALSAAAIWGVATVLGKAMTRGTGADRITFWRYFFGLVTLGLILLLGPRSASWEPLLDPSIRVNLAYMALIPGLLAMLSYYAGMRRTSASVTTFVELLFPVSAVLLNWYFLGMPLSAVQIVAGTVLLFAVTRVSLSES